MKKRSWLCLLLAPLLLASCAADLALPSEPTESVEAAADSGRVTLSGTGAADSTVTAQIEGIDPRYRSVRWFLNEQELATRGETLQIPFDAEGTLVCRVYRGNSFTESEAMAVLPRAEGVTYTFAGLRESVKWIGRTQMVGTGLSADWSGSGFEMRVRAAGECRVFYKCTKRAYYVLSVDGAVTDRPLLDGEGSLSVEMPLGEHTLRLVRDTEIRTDGSGVVFTDLVLEGEVLTRPADKELFLQVIGDSIACGDGALGAYVSGEIWKLEDHSATSGFGCVLSEILDADYDLVARGGIGLLNKAGSYHIRELYPYANRYRDNTKQDFDGVRIPDIIIVEQGTNDGTEKYGEASFLEALRDFVKTLRATWGENVPIVWVGKNEFHYASAGTVAREDARFYALRYAYGGSGAAALATQDHGHPNAAEQREMAEAIARFLRENELV